MAKSEKKAEKKAKKSKKVEEEVRVLRTLPKYPNYPEGWPGKAKDLDYLIVLGAQMRGNDPSTIYKFRLDAAYEYLLDNPDTICVVSGGQGVNETVSEGEGGRDYLIKRGIDPARLIAETNAMDTEENIKYSLAVMETAGKDNTGKLRIGVVTNNFHLFRGIHIARNYTDNYVCGIAAGTIPWYLPNNMVRECFGIIRDYQQHIV